MHDLPRQLTTEQLAELFEGRTRLVEKLAEREDPLGSAREVIAELSEAEKIEALRAHPAIGAGNLSVRSAAEQGAGGDPAVRQRIERTREEELDTALEELVAIAEDRWRHS